MSTRTPIQVERIRAIGLTVTDADRSQAFYTQALGFEPVSDITVAAEDYGITTNARIRIITLKLGEEYIELIDYLNIEGKPIPPDSQSNDLWFQHLAIVVSDMDRAYAYLRSFPIESISTSPQTIPPANEAAGGTRAFKFKDPDRHDLELIWFPSSKGQKKWHQQTDRLFLGIDHTAIAVADTEQSLQFYCDLLGMQVDGGSLNWRETQARMDDLPDAKVQITALRPIQGGLGIELLDYIQPGKGRPIPKDWNSSDIAHMQIELVVNNIKQAIEQLKQKQVQLDSSQLVQFPNHADLHGQGYLIKDPTGHTILLTQEVSMAEVVEIYDDRMRSLICPNASLVKLADGAVHSEGPVYFHEDDSVIWSDAHGNRLLRWHARDGTRVLRDPSDYQSGNYRDLEGRLVSCSSGLRAIIRQQQNGQWQVLCDCYQGKRLNSPNDLVVKRDGTIWFTDPPYGITEPNQGYCGEQEQPGSYVYRFDPATGEIDAVITDMLRPNGLTFSPDEQRLYVSDSSAFNIPNGYHHVRVYDVVEGQGVSNDCVFAVINPGQPDGLRVDEQGNVFISSEDGVQVYAADGTRLGKILVPETVANLTLGGRERDRLIITAGHSLYAIDLNTRGTQI